MSIPTQAAMDSKNLVIGIDLGSADSYVGYIAKGVVDIVQNEVSQRKTPTLVSFTDRERLLGDPALSQIKSNAKNTCRNFKHLLGQQLQAPGMEAEKFWSTCSLAEDANGQLGYSVNYKGEQTTQSALAITAMFLTKLVAITEAWCKDKVADAVIGVPSFFTDFQRAALLDAAEIAGLNVVRLINEHTAVALAYGLYRTKDFDAEKPITVAFCNMGHTIFSVSIVQFVKSKMTVIAEKSEKVGGRDIDECLMRTFAAQFKKKVGCDPLTNKKASFKLEDAVGKTKKILSANSEASCTCECLMEDEDFSGHIVRKDLEEMCKPMMDKVQKTLEDVKALAGIAVSGIDAVEMGGGASRVPFVKEMCSKAFGGKELSTTMNADECVARGAALMAAMVSPLYKVREFQVEDSMPFPIGLSWMPPPAPGDGAAALAERSAVVFPANSVMHLWKIVTFFRKETFQLKVHYSDDKALPPGTPKDLGCYTINVPPQAALKKVKVKAVLTLHGTFAIEGAQLLEDEEAKPDAEKAGDADSERPKKRCKRVDLVVTSSGSPGLDSTALKKLKEEELRMQAEMEEIIECGARRNDLESYIFSMRSNVSEGGKLGSYISSADRDKLMDALVKAEDWIYDHMDDGKEVFIQKLAELKALDGGAEERHRQDSERPELIASLKAEAAKYKALIAKNDATFKKADPSKVAELGKACADADAWVTKMKPEQDKLPKTSNPVLDCAEIVKRTEAIVKMANDLDPSAKAPSSQQFEKPANPDDMNVD